MFNMNMDLSTVTKAMLRLTAGGLVRYARTDEKTAIAVIGFARLYFTEYTVEFSGMKPVG